MQKRQKPQSGGKLRKAAKATQIVLNIVLFMAGVALAATLAWIGYKFGKTIGL